jgi:UDP-N-acetylmuramoyl-tripeptide--D-alanyl-D-alanine ligase
MSILTSLILISSLTWAIAVTLNALRLLLFFQIEEYEAWRFMRWAWRNPLQVAPNRVVLVWSITVLVSGVVVPLNHSLPALLPAFNFGLGSVLAITLWMVLKRPTKKSLVYTLRLMRILITLVGIAITVVLVATRSAALIVRSTGVPEGWVLSLAVFLYGLLVLCAPLWIVLANTLLIPIEEGIRQSYLLKARRKLKRIDPIVIGITGSFGKTSTKEILAHLLSGHHSVLSTPKSYNTPMGICKTINEHLRSEHEIFVVEMGAYQPGDIAEICRLVRPSLGIITAIGPQHLERFGSLDSIARTKFELVDALPNGGIAVFDADDSYTSQFLKWVHNKKTVLVSAKCNELADLCGYDIQTTSSGSQFSILDRRTGEHCSSAVRLLGRHNVLNTLLATALALELGMSLNVIAERIRSVPPIEYRLQLLRSKDGLNIINDAYNSNPVGAKYALEVLAGFEEGQKILVTPGFVELGPIERDAHLELGRQAASICDQIILVGHSRTRPILDGLQEAGFNAAHIRTVSTLAEAYETLGRLSTVGDTVLFLNDLPDTYSEGKGFIEPG